VREKMAKMLVLMGVTGVGVSSRVGGGCANEARPQSVGAPGRAASTLRSSGDTNFGLSWDAAMGDAPSIPGSSDIMDLGNGELVLPGFPRLLLLPADWGQVEEGAEWACLQVTTVHRLL
jgi:hypothetical protein